MSEKPALSFLSCLSEQDLARFEEKGHTTKYNKGYTLFTQDDPADWFYVVKSGWVKLFRETLEGDEVIVDVIPSGESFGEFALFGAGEHTYPFGAEVIEAGEIRAYPLQALRQLVENTPSVALDMLKHIAGKGLQKDREIEHRTVMNAPQRIGCFLLRLCKVNDGKPITLYLPYDKTLIASRLGMQPETFSRALTRLQDDIDIHVQGPVVEIRSLGQLVTYVCKSCSNVFPCNS